MILEACVDSVHSAIAAERGAVIGILHFVGSTRAIEQPAAIPQSYAKNQTEVN